jgi:hypothetical protein
MLLVNDRFDLFPHPYLVEAALAVERPVRAAPERIVAPEAVEPEVEECCGARRAIVPDNTGERTCAVVAGPVSPAFADGPAVVDLEPFVRLIARPGVAGPAAATALA